MRDDDQQAVQQAAGHPLVIADERARQRAFRRARANSLFVRILRVVLPVAAIAMVSSYALFMQHEIRIEAGDVVGTLETGLTPGTNFKNFAMTSPSYQGYNRKNGSRYHVKAERAVTDLSRDKPIELIGIAGTLEQADGRTTRIDAARGIFDQKKHTLTLDGGITVEAPNDLQVNLNRAVVNASTQRIVSDQPVSVSMPGGKVSSNAMELDQKARTVAFSSGVQARLLPRESPTPKPAVTATGEPSPFTASTDPVDVTSAKLTVSQSARTAIFEGNVRAEQSGRTLETPRLTATLADGAALPNLAAGDTQPPGKAKQKGGGLKTLSADDGVVITTANGAVTADTATFDVAANVARLTGDVRIKGAKSGAIEADEANIDTRTSRIVLSGNVTARQDNSLLRGTELVYERAAASLVLTAPARQSAPAGRIFARLYPPASGNAGKARRKQPPARRGAMTFSTDPNAPIEITARSLDVRDIQSRARFEGGVRVRQGDFLLTTPTLIAAYTGRLGLADSAAVSPGGSAMQLTTIRATPPVNITSGDDVSASGHQAHYDVAGEKVTLTGNVILRQGRQIVRGERLLIDLKTGRARMLNAGSGRTATRPLQHGAAPKITANPNQRDCGGQMCAVFYPRDAQRKSGSTARHRPSPSRPAPAIGNGWSTSTRTN